MDFLQQAQADGTRTDSYRLDVAADDILAPSGQESSLLNDARAMLERILDEDWLQARAVLGLFPARREGDDVAVYSDEEQRSLQPRVDGKRARVSTRLEGVQIVEILIAIGGG